MNRFPLLIVIAIAQIAGVDSVRAESASEILKMAREAAAGVKSISYEATLLGEGALKENFAPTEGRVKALFDGEDDDHRIFIVGSRKIPNGQVQSFKFASDGKRACCVKEESRQFLTGESSAGRIPERESLLPRGLFGKNAWSAESAAAAVDLIGQATLADVRCDILEVKYDAAGRRIARFYIGRDDHMLRRIDRPIRMKTSAPAPLDHATVIFAIRNLQVNPKIPADVFQLAKPEGFTEIALGGSKSSKGQAAPDPSSRNATRRPTPPPTARAAAGAQVGADAPDWSLTDAAGETVALKDLRGKVVLLDFWATWCPPCRMAMHGVQKTQEEYKDKALVVLGVNCMERNPNSNPAQVAKNEGASYRQLLNGSGVAAQYGVRALPTFCVIGKDGKILYLAAGYNPAGIEQAIQIGLK